MNQKVRGHIDAKNPLQVHLIQFDLDKGDPNNPANCGVSCGARREHGFEEFIVYRTVSYGRMPDQEKYLKWQNSRGVVEVLCHYDINKERAIKKLPAEGITIIFWPLRKYYSTDYLRSQKKLEVARASKKRRNGQKKKAYRTPDPLTLQGVRWGTKQKT